VKCVLFLLLVFVPFSTSLADIITFNEKINVAKDFIQKKELGELGAIIPKLIELRKENGFSNLVPLSEKLLELSEESCLLDNVNCTYSIDNAVLLSPTDSWILFKASAITPGVLKSAGLFFKSLRYSTSTPTFFYKSIIVFGVCLLALITLYQTVRLLFRIIRLEFKKVTPVSILLIAGLGLIGLPFGILATALCWAVIICVFVGTKKEIVQLLIVTALWVSSLPTVENYLTFVNRPEEREFELLLSRVASPSGKSFPAYLNEPIYLGTKFFQEGEFAKAKEQFQRAASIDPKIAAIANSRLAAADIALRQFTEAKIHLDKARQLGLESYESYHNEALLAASSGNLDSGRQILDKLKQIDNKRVSTDSLALGILLDPLSFDYFSDRYQGIQKKGLQNGAIEWVSSQRMLTPLCIFGIPGLLGLTGLMFVLLIIPTRQYQRVA
jgi:tetratricopeptide (TPR) repeat protein